MLKMMNLLKSKKAQGIVEYALLLAFVVAVATFALKNDSGLGTALKSNFSTTANTVTNFSATGN